MTVGWVRLFVICRNVSKFTTARCEMIIYVSVSRQFACVRIDWACGSAQTVIRVVSINNFGGLKETYMHVK